MHSFILTLSFIFPVLVSALSSPQTRHHSRRANGKRVLPSGWSSLGCATDSDPRALPSYSFWSATLTLDSCVAECDARGFTYAGAEYGGECYCANGLANGQGNTAPSTECNTPCNGNPSLLCGGPWRLSLFTKTTSPSTGAWSSGTCIQDSDTRVLSAYHTTLSNNTPGNCQAVCAERGYTIAGVQYSNECWCDTQYRTSVTTAPSNECSMPCSGDSSQTCGGGYRMWVYTKSPDPTSTTTSTTSTSTSSTSSTSTTTSPTPTPTQYWCTGTCVQDSTTRLLSAYSTTLSNNTPANCQAVCLERGYTIAGVQYSNECWCDTQYRTAVVTASAGDCGMPCAGDSSQTCGGGYRMWVYTRTSDPPTTTTSSSTSSTSSSPTPTAEPSKFVVAHHMVGNTYPYDFAAWLRDITLASANGIDGFALNVGINDWQPARVADAYAAALASGTGFKLFMSFDMTSLPCSEAWHRDLLRKYITDYANHPSQLKHRGGKIVVSTFAGEYCTFGQGSVNQGWQTTVKDGLPAVSFIPSFFVEPSTFGNYPVSDGDFNWNGGWPMGDYDVNMDMDNRHLAGLSSGKAFMAAVSPWFFTHYGADSWNKNWIYRGDNWLYNSRWEQIIQNRDRMDIVQIVTWNDYGESSYIGPIAGDQPNSHAWVDGYDHLGWLALTQYYATAYKTGSYPAITHDRIYMWARPHPAAADAPDYIGRPNNWQWTQDYLWVVVFATTPGEVFVQSGSNTQQTSITAGVNKIKLSLSPGSIRAQLLRSGNTIVDLIPAGYSYTTSPPSYNFNAFVAASP